MYAFFILLVGVSKIENAQSDCPLHIEFSSSEMSLTSVSILQKRKKERNVIIKNYK